LRGGIADFNEALCRSYKSQGIDCSIVSFSLQYPSVLFPGKTQYVPEGTPHPEFEVIPLLNSVNPLSWSKTAKKIKELAPDYVLSSYWLPFAGFSMACVLKKLKKDFKLISLAHNVIPHQKMPFDTAITRFYIKQNDGFVLLSDAVSNDLNKFAPEAERVVVPHPVYDIFGEKVSKKEALSWLGLDDGNYILFFGIIKPYKGLKYLLEAFASEEVKNIDAKLIVAGEFYEDKKPYLEIIEKNNMKDRVVLLDKFIPNSEVKYLFSASDVVVQPYLSATQSGITMVAYNFGKPMIITNVNEMREIVKTGETGFVVPPKDSGALAKALVEFYSMRRIVDFEKNVIKMKDRFSWRNFIKEINRLYDEIK